MDAVSEVTASAEAILTERTGELAEVEAEIARVNEELYRLDKLPEVRQADVVAIENSRRSLRRLSADRYAAGAAVEEARTALAAAERERDLAIVASVRAEVAKRRAALDAKIAALATSDDIASAAFAMQVQDPLLENLRGEVVALQSCRAPLAGIRSLTSDEIKTDTGPWLLLALCAGHAFFAAIVRHAERLRAARDAVERERVATEEARNRVDPRPHMDENGRLYFTEDQIARLPRDEHGIAVAKADPHRARVLFPPERLALIAAQDEHAARALERAGAWNRAGLVPPVARPAHHMDLTPDEESGGLVVEGE